jgi:hypothetical protein
MYVRKHLLIPLYLSSSSLSCSHLLVLVVKALGSIVLQVAGSLHGVSVSPERKGQYGKSRRRHLGKQNVCASIDCALFVLADLCLVMFEAWNGCCLAARLLTLLASTTTTIIVLICTSSIPSHLPYHSSVPSHTSLTVLSCLRHLGSCSTPGLSLRVKFTRSPSLLPSSTSFPDRTSEERRTAAKLRGRLLLGPGHAPEDYIMDRARC